MQFKRVLMSDLGDLGLSLSTPLEPRGPNIWMSCRAYTGKQPLLCRIIELALLLIFDTGKMFS